MVKSCLQRQEWRIEVRCKRARKGRGEEVEMERKDNRILLCGGEEAVMRKKDRVERCRIKMESREGGKGGQYSEKALS
jgi:hypothetical protein